MEQWGVIVIGASVAGSAVARELARYRLNVAVLEKELDVACGNVTRAEIRRAIRNPLGVHTVTGIKNRTRATMGRCQGGYCETRITEMIEQELGLDPDEVRYSKPGSYMFCGRVREQRCADAVAEGGADA